MPMIVHIFVCTYILCGCIMPVKIYNDGDNIIIIAIIVGFLI